MSEAAFEFECMWCEVPFHGNDKKALWQQYREHVNTCPHHPMRQLEARIEELEETERQLRDCIASHEAIHKGRAEDDKRRLEYSRKTAEDIHKLEIALNAWEEGHPIQMCNSEKTIEQVIKERGLEGKIFTTDKGWHFPEPPKER